MTSTTIKDRMSRSLKGLAQGIGLVAGAAALATFAPPAAAQNWPSQPVSLVVPYPAGGAIDASARRVAEFLSTELGEPVLVVNRAGANSVVGSTFVSRATADGYTLLYTTLVAQAGNVHSYENLPFDTLADFIAITAIQAPPNVLVAHPGVPADTFDQLVEHVRANPGDVTFGTNGPGSPAHLRGAQMNQLGEMDMALIGYPGGAAALADLIGGHVMLYPAQYSAIISLVEAGQAKVLAALGPVRLDGIPDVASITETPGFEEFEELATFPLVMAPAGTPDAVVSRIHEAFVAVIANPEFLAVSQRAQEYPPFATNPAETEALLLSYIELIGSLTD